MNHKESIPVPWEVMFILVGPQGRNLSRCLFSKPIRQMPFHLFEMKRKGTIIKWLFTRSDSIKFACPPEISFGN